MAKGKYEKKQTVPARRHILPMLLIITVSLLLIAASGVFLIINGTRSKQQPIPKETSEVSQTSKDIDPSTKDAFVKELSEIKIILKFDDKTEKLTGNDIIKLVDIYEENNKWQYIVNQEKIQEYTSMLAQKYDTFVPYYKINTTNGGEVTLNNISVGWTFDSNHAAYMISYYLTEHQSVTLDLTDKSDESNRWWIRRASDYQAIRKRGSCYAEVSIDLQYMWLYKDGAVVLESPVVTGNPNTGNDTPKGAFVIQERVSPATLYGEGWERPVSYWMAFNYDVGFHDAVWQNYFGGNYYLENGSHGCVNLPLGIAEELYKNCYVYMPVYVY